MNSVTWSTVAEFAGLAMIIGVLIFVVFHLSQNRTYRYGLLLAFVPVFLVLWINLAVGIIGEPEDPANLMYIAVPAVAVIGAIVVQFEASGMARALTLAACVQGLVAVVTLLTARSEPARWLWSLLVLNAVLVALWMGSAALFRKAAEARIKEE